MRKVITGSLNGNACQFEEGAFAVIAAYLQTAAARSADNPDQAELLSDLEQTIADKCDALLGKHRNVLSSEQAQQILREMGPVDDGTDPGAAAAAADHAASARAASAAPRERRLYRIPGEGMMGGVCAGVAAYFAIDVVWIRLAYILLTLTTGVWFLVWLAQLCITPKAITPEQLHEAQSLRGAFGS